MLLFYYGQIALGNTDPVLIRDYIVVESLIAGVDPRISTGVAYRESKFNCNAVGDGGKSHGCFQIYSPAHPTVTKEQATDVVWSTQWSLNEMKKNGCEIWSTCEATMKSISSRDR